MAMEKRCSKCRTVLEEGVKFCPECGLKVPQAINEVKEEVKNASSR